MRRAVSRLLLLPFIISSLHANVEMESPAAGADFDFFARERSVVTAGRMLQPSAEVPASIKVFTAEDIERLGARTLADLLRLVPGMDVRVSNDINAEQVRVDNRGLLGSSTIINKRILLMLDGRPVNAYHYGNFHVDERTSLDNVRQVEVIKGPASSLYGNNAMDGVINLITKSPEDAPGLEYGFSVGSFGARSQQVQYGRPGRGGAPSVYAAGRWFETKGPGLVNANEAKHDGNLFVKAEWRRLDVAAGWDQSTTEYSGRTTLPSTQTRQHSRGSFIDVRGRWSASGSLDVVPRFYANFLRDEFGWFPFTEVRYDMRHETRLGTDLQANWRVDPRHNIVFGGELRQNDASYSFLPQMGATESALYAQAEGRPWDPLSWTLGGRWDRNSKSPSFSSPRAGLVYRPGPAWTLKTFYGGAFRGASFSELRNGYPLLGIWFDSNPNLAPEHIRSFEAVVELHPAPAFRLQTAFFNNSVKDLMALRPTFLTMESLYPMPSGTYPTLPVSRVMNSGRASIWGLELEGEVRPSPRLVLWGNYSYLNTDNNDISSPARQPNSVQGRLPYAPRNKANGGLAWTFSEALNGGVQAHYVGQRRHQFTSLNSLPSFIVWDALLRARPAPGWTVTAGLYNVADKAYQETAWVPMPGRSFQGGVERKF